MSESSENNSEHKELINNQDNKKLEECFVIMPISDPDNYKQGHFKMVYEDIFIPAIRAAGFMPHRADDNKSSHIIELDIVKRIIEAPMALCDLSNKNPNVLFELGIRQAFNKPVVLVQDNNVDRIFDVGSINTIPYGKECIYKDVLRDQDNITTAIKETYDGYKKGDCINSLINLLDVKPAEAASNQKLKDNDLLKVIFNEVMDLKGIINKKNNCEKHIYDEIFIKLRDRAENIINDYEFLNKNLSCPNDKRQLLLNDIKGDIDDFYMLMSKNSDYLNDEQLFRLSKKVSQISKLIDNV